MTTYKETWDGICKQIIHHTEPKDRKKISKTLESQWTYLSGLNGWTETTKNQGKLLNILLTEEKRADTDLVLARQNRDKTGVWKKGAANREIEKAEDRLRQWSRVAAAMVTKVKSAVWADQRDSPERPPPYSSAEEKTKTPSAPMQMPVMIVKGGEIETTTKQANKDYKFMIKQGAIEVEETEEDKKQRQLKTALKEVQTKIEIEEAVKKEIAKQFTANIQLARDSVNQTMYRVAGMEERTHITLKQHKEKLENIKSQLLKLQLEEAKAKLQNKMVVRQNTQMQQVIAPLTHVPAMSPVQPPQPSPQPLISYTQSPLCLSPTQHNRHTYSSQTNIIEGAKKKKKKKKR